MPPPAPTPNQFSRPESVASSGSVRHVTPEDAFYDGHEYGQPIQNRPQSYHELKASMRQNERDSRTDSYPSAPASRQISNTSSHTTISGSENWQTIEDDSEPERDATEAYYAKLRAARSGKRFTPEDYPEGGQSKKQKGIPPYTARAGLTDAEGRIVSGSEAAWTDEEAF